MNAIKVTAEKSFEIECQDVMDYINDTQKGIVFQLPTTGDKVEFLAVAKDSDAISEIKSTFQNEAECNVEDITNYKL